MTDLRTTFLSAGHDLLTRVGGPLDKQLRALIDAVETRLDTADTAGADNATDIATNLASITQLNSGGPAATVASAGALAAGRYDAAGTTGLAMTLPAATGSGDVIEVFFSATVSSGSHTIAADGTDILQGHIGVGSDASGVIETTAADSDIMTMNGTTTGAVAGSWLRFMDAASGVWNVTGHLVASGAEATVFGSS